MTDELFIVTSKKHGEKKKTKSFQMSNLRTGEKNWPLFYILSSNLLVPRRIYYGGYVSFSSQGKGRSILIELVKIEVIVVISNLMATQ
jgi:hypothetical protein